VILTFRQIRDCMHGAARVIPQDGCIHFKRFTEEQENLIRSYSAASLIRAETTAGITLEMETDSENLTLSVEVANAFRGGAFSHSILVNGQRVGQLRGKIPDGATVSMDGTFSLGQGLKRVQIVFPWSADSAVRYLQLDEGAVVRPIVRQKTMLIFGDSITQGYDTQDPENAYSLRLAEYLGASARNKSIGGIRFYPPLAQLPDDVKPDILLISYGGNDWHSGNKSEFEQSSVLFCQSLRQLYPNAKMIVMMPFCAEARQKNEPHWHFAQLQQHLRELPEKIDNLLVMESSDFVPADPVLFHSDGVHPLDAGHTLHYQKIVNALEQTLY